MSNVSRRSFNKILGATAAFSAMPSLVRAQGKEVRVLVTRTPSLTFLAEKVKENSENVPVSIETMLLDKIFEVGSIAFSSNAPGIDVIHMNNTGLKLFASKGWFEPLDDLWAKYKDEYKLDDFPEIVMDSMSYEGHIYAMPVMMNTQMLFYRKDIFAQLGMQPPKTMEEYLALPPKLQEAGVPNITGGMKPVDYAVNRLHWFLNTLGDGWFDDKWNPTFNTAKSISAVEKMKELIPYIPRGWTNSGNDEDSINLSQGISSLGLQWTSRAGQMQDPAKSTVVDKMDWTIAPGGGARIAFDGFAIPKSSNADKEQVFRMLCAAMSAANMKENAGRAYPARTSVLSDPELGGKYPWYDAAKKSLEVNKGTPALPEFVEVSEIVVPKVMQGLTGEAEIATALNSAASDVTAFLTTKGYYKG